MTDEQEFALSDAKDYLSGICDSIIRTRDRCWHLLAFVLAVNFYFIQDHIFSKDPMTPLEVVVSTIWFGCGVWVVFLLKRSIQPSDELAINGRSPKTLRKIMSDNSLDFFEEVLEDYNAGVNINRRVLRDLAIEYNRAFVAVLVSMVLSVALFVGFYLCKGTVQ